MVSVCKLGGTINQTGVKGGKSKRSKIPPQSLSFSFSPRPRFSRLAARGSPLTARSLLRSIVLKTLGKEGDCSQSTKVEATNGKLRDAPNWNKHGSDYFATLQMTSIHKRP